MTDTLALRPSDAVNLADDRADCEKCDCAGVIAVAGEQGAESVIECPRCDGRGSYVNPTGRAHLSHSSISTQLNCLKRYEHERVSRLELVARPRYFGMGSAFQKAIELADPDAGADKLREGLMLRSQHDEDGLAIEEATVRAAAKLYLRRFGTPENERREFEYRVRLRSPWTGAPSRTFDLLGFADGVIETPGWLELVENKFVGQIDKVMVKRLPLDRQVGLACYGLWRATGKTVRVVHYRMIRKPSIKQKKGRETKQGLKGAETVDEFIERLEADYANPEREEHYVLDETLFRSDEDLLQIEAELWDWAEQLRNAKGRSFYSRNTSHCHDYGGCPYIPLCVGDPDAPALYRERPERELEKEARKA